MQADRESIRDNQESMSITADFDLNVEKVLEAWSISHAIREFIANALDEQALSASEPVQISRVADGVWVIRDFGRGLRHAHLTQNESLEKHTREAEVIGRFGVGLKDALAVLSRRGVDVSIQSAHCEISLVQRAKAGFSDVRTLHARISEPSDRTMRGTQVLLRGITDLDMTGAKRFFLAFSGDARVERTKCGEVLHRAANGPARIYVKGLVIAEEENFAFSYNITSLTESMRRALNRERTNVGRGAYSDRIKAILLASESNEVAAILAADLAKLSDGASRDEVRLWTDVGVRAAQVLNARNRVLFVTSDELWDHRALVDIARGEGRSVVVVPELIRTKLESTPDMYGNPIQSIRQFGNEWNDSFEYQFVSPEVLAPDEQRLFALWPELAEAAGGLPACVSRVVISSTMRPSVVGGFDADGIWDPRARQIVIHRRVLESAERFSGVFLHELAHARSGASDVSREFETALTDIIGRLASRYLRQSPARGETEPARPERARKAEAPFTGPPRAGVKAIAPASGQVECVGETPGSKTAALPTILEFMGDLTGRLERVRSAADMARVFRDLTGTCRFSVDATPHRLPAIFYGLQVLAQRELAMIARVLGGTAKRGGLKPTAATTVLASFVTGLDGAIPDRPERERGALRALRDECHALLDNPRVLAEPSAYSDVALRVAELFDVLQS
jgi:hypothetical protein